MRGTEAFVTSGGGDFAPPDPDVKLGGAMRCATRHATPLGEVILEGDAELGALTGLWFAGQRHMPARPLVEGGDLPVLDAARAWLDAYLSGGEPPEVPPLALEGTPFQRAVWSELRGVPRGKTITYGDLATRLGSSPRAVGSAVARNPLSLVVPCHRVVGAGGSLTGYAGGVWRKRALLALEREGVRVGEAESRPDGLVAELARVWEASVRATHDFLAEGEVERLAPLVPGYVLGVPRLLVAYGTSGAPGAPGESAPVGFLGLDGESVEMLFVAPAWRGRGVGRLLMERAIELHGAREVSVNEENPQAVGFYERMGFSTLRREELDGQGAPHPLLVMRLT